MTQARAITIFWNIILQLSKLIKKSKQNLTNCKRKYRTRSGLNSKYLFKIFLTLCKNNRFWHTHNFICKDPTPPMPSWLLCVVLPSSGYLRLLSHSELVCFAASKQLTVPQIFNKHLLCATYFEQTPWSYKCWELRRGVIVLFILSYRTKRPWYRILFNLHLKLREGTLMFKKLLGKSVGARGSRQHQENETLYVNVSRAYMNSERLTQ